MSYKCAYACAYLHIFRFTIHINIYIYTHVYSITHILLYNIHIHIYDERPLNRSKRLLRRLSCPASLRPCCSCNNLPVRAGSVICFCFPGGPPPSSTEGAASSTRQTNVLLPPGKETHNPPYPFVTILAPRVAPELRKNSVNSSCE